MIDETTVLLVALAVATTLATAGNWLLSKGVF